MLLATVLDHLFLLLKNIQLQHYLCDFNDRINTDVPIYHDISSYLLKADNNYDFICL